MHKHLVDNLQDAATREFAEQDMLNNIYKDKVSFMKPSCNVIVSPAYGSHLGARSSTIALHRKPWEIRTSWLPKGM